MKINHILRIKPKLGSIRMGLPILLTILLIFTFLGIILITTPATADPGTLYVDGSTGTDIGDCQNMESPCQSVAYALSQAVQFDEIWVAQGVYTENLVINSGVALMGGYEASDWTRDLESFTTILDGNHSGSVVTFQGTSEGMAIDGFQVTGGNATSGGMGGGITMDESSPTIRNTTVISNQAVSDGGGIYITGGMPTIEDSQILENNANGCCGGIHIGNNARVTISNTMLSDNNALMGGGIGIFSGSITTITKSAISANNSDFDTGQGGGIHVGGQNSIIHIMDSILANNQTRDHGAAISSDGGTVNLINVLITDNQSSSQNANVFAISNTEFNVMNSTIADNNPGGAQAVLLWSGGLTMTNSIMWNNALNLQVDPGCLDCTVVVTFSDFDGGWTGTGNINQDPRFTDIDDYHLQSVSPCINKGTSIGAPILDIDGNPRDDIPDMGAFEWIGSRQFLPLLFNNGY